MSEEYQIRLCEGSERAAAQAIENLIWPEFNWQADGSITQSAYDPDLHLVAVDADGQLVATIDAVGFDWDGDPRHLPAGGWAEVVRRENEGYARQPDWACALGASVLPEIRSGGLAGRMLAALRDQALSCGYTGLIAPVLPSFRWRCPTLPLSAYVRLRLPDGRHFDPWVRTHERVGGKIVGFTERSASFGGTREQWQQWAGLKLPDDGRVLISEGQGFIELSGGYGTLHQPSIWVAHQPDISA